MSDSMDLIAHWRCRICDTFDGPISDRNCDVCAQEGITERVEEFVPASQLAGAVEALRELVDAGEPFVGDAFPSGEMTGNGLRLFNRWQAAMNDARTAIRGQS